ncbi:hypothetical protein GCM10023238_36430 [Streptomyces heliomycini]
MKATVTDKTKNERRSGKQKKNNLTLQTGTAFTASSTRPRTEIARYDLSETPPSETAYVFGELYRNGAEWKFRAVGQGYASGPAGSPPTIGVGV